MAIALGLIASILVVLMSLIIKRDNVVKLSIVLGVTTTAQYAVLHEWGTVWLTSISALYAVCLLFAQRYPALGSQKVAYALVIVYTTGFIAINGVNLSWGLFSYAASILGALMLLISNPLGLKYAMLVNGVLWTVFQVSSGAYGQLPGELLYVAGIIYSVIMLSRAKKRGVDLRLVPEITTVINSKLSQRKKEKENKGSKLPVL